MNRKFQEKDLVLATHNFGKIEEFKHLFGKVNFNITDIGQYSGKTPEETGVSLTSGVPGLLSRGVSTSMAAEI